MRRRDHPHDALSMDRPTPFARARTGYSIPRIRCKASAGGTTRIPCTTRGQPTHQRPLPDQPAGKRSAGLRWSSRWSRRRSRRSCSAWRRPASSTSCRPRGAGLSEQRRRVLRFRADGGFVERHEDRLLRRRRQWRLRCLDRRVAQPDPRPQRRRCVRAAAVRFNGHGTAAGSASFTLRARADGSASTTVAVARIGAVRID